MFGEVNANAVSLYVEWVSEEFEKWFAGVELRLGGTYSVWRWLAFTYGLGVAAAVGPYEDTDEGAVWVTFEVGLAFQI